MQWHPVRNRGVTPDEVPAGSHRHVWWMCKQGHEWQAEVRCRTLYGNGCPFCANRAVLTGFNDLATLYPELAAEWHPTKNGALTPEQVLAGSEKRVWWQCGRGHAWQTSVSTRTRANCRCPVCTGRTVLAGENDLATLSPELAAEWHPTLNGALTPDMVTAGRRRICARSPLTGGRDIWRGPGNCARRAAGRFLKVHKGGTFYSGDKCRCFSAAQRHKSLGFAPWKPCSARCSRASHSIGCGAVSHGAPRPHPAIFAQLARVR